MSNYAYVKSPRRNYNSRRRSDYEPVEYGSTGSGSGYEGGGSAGGSFSGSGSGHGGGGGMKTPCCPLVVDTLTLAAILGLIAGATAFLNVLITMSLRRRRKRRDGTYALNAASVSEKISDVIFSSKLSMHFLIPFFVSCYFQETLSGFRSL